MTGSDSAVGCNGIECASVRENDMVERYVTGKLPESEAEAFERHYFACDDCWRAVEDALAVRAAFQRAGGAQGARAGARRRPRATWRGWAAVGAAAAVAVVLFGVWRIEGERGASPMGEAVRGSETTIEIRSEARADALAATWTPHPEAEVYVVGLYTGEGNVLFEREVTEPHVEVARGSLPELPPGSELFWSVEALNSLRRVVARSRLTKLVLTTD